MTGRAGTAITNMLAMTNMSAITDMLTGHAGTAQTCSNLADQSVLPRSSSRRCVRTSVSSVLGQGTPPLLEIETAVRVRAREAGEHEDEQPDQPAQAATTQSTGHVGAATPAQDLVSASSGQAAPPETAADATARVREPEPAPHVTEHVDQLVHAATTHADGHCCWLQLPPSRVASQAYCIA